MQSLVVFSRPLNGSEERESNFPVYGLLIDCNTPGAYLYTKYIDYLLGSEFWVHKMGGKIIDRNLYVSPEGEKHFMNDEAMEEFFAKASVLSDITCRIISRDAFEIEDGEVDGALVIQKSLVDRYGK